MKTAYSPLFQVKVFIDREFIDSHGKPILVCHSEDPLPGFSHNIRLHNHLFRETELTNIGGSEK